MARRRKKRPGPPTEPSAEERTASPVPAWVGGAIRASWLLFAAGAAAVVIMQGALLGLIGAAVMVAATGLRMVARFRRDADARRTGAGVPSDPWSLPLGVALIAAGATGLLYPALVEVETFREIVAAHPYGPFAAVALVVSGLLTLLDHLDRAAPSEPDFAVPDPPTLGEKLALINPLQIPLAVGAVFVPRLWQRVPLAMFLYESWVELDREAVKEKEARRERGEYDWRPLAVFCLGAVFLSLMEYFGHHPDLRDLVTAMNPPGEEATPFWARALEIHEGPFGRLMSFMWWSGWRLLGFFLLPALVLKLLGERIADHGLQVRGFASHAWIYGVLLIPVLVAVVGVSFEDSFKLYYPFYKASARSWYDFWAWEALYAVQFFSLEFFFRGFWVKASKSMMGSHAIFAMVVPYCMIHFGKPFAETIAAILAGVVLGTLALRTRSIWSGFLIHVTVAISMDLAALMQTTGLPTRFWPDL